MAMFKGLSGGTLLAYIVYSILGWIVYNAAWHVEIDIDKRRY